MALETLDYVVFAMMFVFSAGAGFFAVFQDRRKKNTMENFHRASRKAHPIAVAMSLSVTIYSGLTIIGIPAEVYTNGTMASWMALGMLGAVAGTAHIFLPIFYNMNKISTFEYITLRFGTTPRTLATITYVLCYFVIHGFILYAPCLAFQVLTKVSLYVIMAVAAAVCILYTLLGGMKAVVWADCLQYVVILAGLLSVLIVTVKEAGGFGNVWDVANKYERLEFFNFSADPRTRHTVWSLGIGFGLLWTYAYGVNQATIQRASSLPTLRQAQISVWLNYIFLVVIFALLIIIGVAMFGFYHLCDPVKNGRIMKKDQMLSLIIIDLLSKIPGLSGLMLAVLFSGSLSTVSSGLSAYSAILAEEFVKRTTRKKLSESVQIYFSKICVVVIGCAIFSVGVGISRLDGLLNQALLSIGAVIAGPMLGMYVAGMIFPWTNSKGASCGFVTSVGMVLWLYLGTLINMKPSGSLPVSTEGCSVTNTTMLPMNKTSSISLTSSLYSNMTTQTVMMDTTEEPALYDFYRMSYTWYTGFAMLINLTVALVVSFLTGATDPKDIDPKLMFPLFYKLCPFLPQKYRNVLLFGVQYDFFDNGEKPRATDDKSFPANEPIGDLNSTCM